MAAKRRSIDFFRILLEVRKRPVGEDLTAEINNVDGGAGAEADYLLLEAPEERADEPNDGSRLPTSYCKDGPAVEIGGCRASVVDVTVGANARCAAHVPGRELMPSYLSAS